MEALLYFAVWAAFIFLMMRFGCGAHVMGHGHRETKKHGRGDQHVSDDLRCLDHFPGVRSVEAHIREAFPEAKVLIHQDPHSIEEPRAHFV